MQTFIQTKFLFASLIDSSFYYKKP